MRSRVSRLLAGTSLVALASVSAGGCAKKKPTAIVVAIQSEAPIPKEVDSLEIQVDRGDSTPFFQVYDLAVKPEAEAHLPGTLALQKQDSEDSSSTVTVTIRARLGSNQTRIVRQARLGFMDEKTKLLRMPLHYSCLDFPTACETGQVCVGGECKSPDVDVATLPDFDARLVAFAPSLGACFDESMSEKGCFRSATTVPVDPSALSGCVLDLAKLVPTLGEGAGNLNLALHWAQAIDAGQFNTIDQSTDEGWSFVAGSTTRVNLTGGICRALSPQGGQPPRVTALRISNVCAPKTADKPVCDTAGQPRSKTLSDSQCYQCMEEPSQCKPQLDAATAEPASRDYMLCVAGCAIGGGTGATSYVSPMECPAACRQSCAAAHIPQACQSNLGGAGCEQFARVGAYRLCLDTKFGTLNVDSATRTVALYQACQPKCDAEGFQNICLGSTPGKKVQIPVMGTFTDGKGHTVVGTSTTLELRTDTAGTSVTLETYAPATTVNGATSYEALVLDSKSGQMTSWPTTAAPGKGVASRFWLKMDASGSFLADLTAVLDTGPGPGFTQAGPFSMGSSGTGGMGGAGGSGGGGTGAGGKGGTGGTGTGGTGTGGTGGGPTCVGRVPDVGPAATVSAMGAPSDGKDALFVELAKLLDGYAEPVVPGTGTLKIRFTSFTNGCGNVQAGTIPLGAQEVQLGIFDPTLMPIATKTYTADAVGAISLQLDPTAVAGQCLGIGASDPVWGTTSGTGVTITAIDANHVAGTFDFVTSTLTGGAPISGTFDVPFCAPKANLDPPVCCQIAP